MLQLPETRVNRLICTDLAIVSGGFASFQYILSPLYSPIVLDKIPVHLHKSGAIGGAIFAIQLYSMNIPVIFPYIRMICPFSSILFP